MPEFTAVSIGRCIRMTVAVALGVAGALTLLAVSGATAQTTHTYYLPVVLLGRPIAFGSERDGNFYLDLYLMEPDGTNVHRVAGPRSVYCPSWSPQGDRLVFMDRMLSDLVLIDPNDGELTRVTSSAAYEGFASWSPTGALIAFEATTPQHSGLYTINRDGTDQKTLIAETGANYWHPSWAPDGKRVAFESNRDGPAEIYLATIGADGALDMSTLVRLTNNDDWDGGPSWSPNGDRIAFHSYKNNNYEIFTVKTDGTELRQLTTNQIDDMEVSWSPDGLQLLFTSWHDDATDIYSVNADGTALTRLTDSPGLDRCASWRP